MNAALVAIVCFLAFAVAHWSYGRLLGRRVFGLDPERATPAHRFRDGVDFVPTRVPVLFGHHFASIAGLGPILGPAIAVIWGWVPAILWVVLGSILIGGIHDLGALTVSLRHDGRSIGDACRDVVGQRARLLFLIVIFFLMSLAMGAFVNAIAALFVRFRPDAILPSVGLMVVAMVVGIATYRWGISLGRTTALGLVVFLGLIVAGVEFPLPTHHVFVRDEAVRTELAALIEQGKVKAPYGAAAELAALKAAGGEQSAAVAVVQQAAERAQTGWMYALLAYGLIASILPVWLLLQPRDYINSFQLYAALALMLVGLTAAALTGSPAAQIDAPAIRFISDAPPFVPFLFVTIACGAVSGFHSLVSSGTTVRQLNRETDAVAIGYGGMLTEGALAVLVILACAAGLGASAWSGAGEYASWSAIKGGGLAVQLDAVVRGAGNFVAHLGIPFEYAVSFLAVTVTAFALTTLDSATRLLRFNVEEIMRAVGLPQLANRYFGSVVAVGGIAWFAFSRGGKSLWTLFGTTNQLLAGLTLLTVTVYLMRCRRPVWYTAVPMVLMLSVTIAAMILQLRTFLAAPQPNYTLIVVSAAVLVLAVWLVVETSVVMLAVRNGRAERTAVAAAGREAS